MVAVGPLHPEQASFKDHTRIRNEVAAIERALADWFRGRGYKVLGSHPRPGLVDEGKFKEVTKAFSRRFPPTNSQK
jgi:hypothetical protein